ncbi:MAG: hypothetical protein FWD17_05930 [Polyangiaceae bacterium]|nr:hypothetical protein [Polyangiaceae bacterium]
MQFAIESRSPHTRAGRTGPSVQRVCTLECVAPFELRHGLAFLQKFGPTAGDYTVSRGVVTKAVVVFGRPLVVRAFQPRSPSGGVAPRLRVALVSDRDVDSATVDAALDGVAFFLGARDDLSAFYARAARDPDCAAVVERLHGFHPVKLATPFETACWAALHAGADLASARRTKDALITHLGPAIELDDGTYRAFPDAASVAGAGVDRLAALLGHEPRARALAAVAQAFSTVGDAFLRDAPLSDVRGWLETLHGMGPFAASFVLFWGLGRFDARTPFDDARFARAASAVYGRALGPGDVASMAKRYGPWAGHWMQYVLASGDVGLAAA